MDYSIRYTDININIVDEHLVCNIVKSIKSIKCSYFNFYVLLLFREISNFVFRKMREQ